MLPAFLNRLTQIFSARVLISGTLPALLLMGYTALFLTLLTHVPVASIWSESVTLTTVMALLGLILLTYLFQSLRTVFARWLCGAAPWIPEWLTERWRRSQNQQRHKLNLRLRDVTETIERLPQRSEHWEQRLSQYEYLLQEEPVENQYLSQIREKARNYVIDLDKDYIGDIDRMVSELLSCLYAPTSRGAFRSARYEIMKVLIQRVRSALSARLGELERERVVKYPQDESVSPTRFGNRSAAIDSYAGERYGMDANLLWPRLRQANKQADAWQAVDDARAALDFIVAGFWVHVLAAVATIALAPALWMMNPAICIAILLTTLCFALASHTAALEAVSNYGAELSAALDVNRWSLLSAMHLPAPLNAEEEYEAWMKLGNWIRFEPDKRSRARILYR